MIDITDMLPSGQPEDEDLSWQADALCAQTDPDAFFPENGGDTGPAKRICEACDVREQCLAYALRHNERSGIWGGMSTGERDRYKRGLNDQPTLARGHISRTARDAAIVLMFADDISAADIAAEFNITDRTVHRVLARHREQQSDADRDHDRDAA